MGDLTGQTFGRLAVLERTGRTAKGHPKWRVRCTSCDEEKEMQRGALLAIASPTAGCDLCEHLDQLKQEFLTGQTVGGGCVVDYVGRDRHGFHSWRCRCQCGAESMRETGNLRRAIKTGSIACRRCAHLGDLEMAGVQQKPIRSHSYQPTRPGRRRVDLVGEVNGRLKVVGYAEPHPITGQTMLLVECQVCGEQKMMQVGNFRGAKHCTACQGMRKDLTGYKNGRLEVLGFAHSADWKAYWQCQCACGAVVLLSTSALTHEHQQSCGRCVRDHQQRVA
ncbi:hypothetical protein [Siccirubricoccus sp. G192]|uniref:hypothetical protein n=1 Tax=Siccirubricoccus sp. G192 TaxID=2849651 RepID=UPI001C2BD847|nr:hypothetical protein [Siccirubricoccus sp. G192]MBV1800641.1 hypothetical protein [Siccirubricoccus sp. G192]